MLHLPLTEAAEQHPLSHLEAALIEAFRRLSERQQQCLLELVEALADHSP